ncbi:PepSY-associated TM helix domain-containing protein [Shewanella gelidii]|uniref:PepSY domain-containing protein n=1 Tax=Shewanella gelidii TaxID=1642821 RepID=A0A917N6M9_9GAMM|nr:PepSY-associated TM helix domain-containing protein [Shewanella gelidii]MCL1096925.1 PepSY domain-containing protein [Shewanella gelidii]GGI71251.1 hypothetical protein GCM10009332_05670 [Shewanella gelidii]
MTRRHPNLRVKLLRLLRPWHRRIGILSALFILLLASTGILINHSHDLGIDRSHVHSEWLLDYYGIKPPQQINVLQLTPQLIAAADNQLWFGSQRIMDSDSSFVGIATFEQGYAIANQQTITLLSLNGQIIETQDSSSGLPEQITAIGTSGQQIWVQGQQRLFLADQDFIEWQPATPLAPIAWFSARPQHQLAPQQRATINLNTRAMHLSWERVLLDLHSGRLFGDLGRWFMDLAALALIFISVTGFVIWWQQKPAKHPKIK